MEVSMKFYLKRRYRVNYGDLTAGHFKDFWFYKNAEKFAKTKKELFVDIEDTHTKIPYTIIKQFRCSVFKTRSFPDIIAEVKLLQLKK